MQLRKARQFGHRDLAELECVLESGRTVVSMREVHAGARGDDVIGLRHDVDHLHGSLDTALKIAAWEHERGYRSTFFLLHTAPYWRRRDFFSIVDEIAGFGHEIGIHANAIAHALRRGGDAANILERAIGELRDHGFEIRGVVAHGDSACRTFRGAPRFVNDEMFAECRRPELGDADRVIRFRGRRLRLAPQPLAHFGLEYEWYGLFYRLPQARYLCDSGGIWNVPPSSVVGGPGQLHVLWHPDWWLQAFSGPASVSWRRRTRPLSAGT